MSRETTQWLNTMTLIGFTEKRGNAWHFSDAHQGELSNHYPGAVPVGDVSRRLFNWEPVSLPLFVPVPVVGGPNDGNTEYVQVDGRQAISRSNAPADVMGIFKDGYQAHGYNEWLLGVTSNIIGDTLSVGSAGLLRRGAQAWVSIEVPENIHTTQGVVFRPNLLAVTSLDGSLATTYKRVVTNVVCDNTMSAGLAEKGQAYKLKHTRNSTAKIAEAREALELLSATVDDFTAEVEALTATTVTDAQWAQFLDIHIPRPEEKGRSQTIADRKRDEIQSLYTGSPMVEPWKGTAYGVVQAVNTHAHHVMTVRGKSRVERNWQSTILGDFDALDTQTMETLGKVLQAA